MFNEDYSKRLVHIKSRYPGKFVSVDTAFKKIKRGSTIFIGTACGEPQYLVYSLTEYVQTHPRAFCDAEILHFLTIGRAAYTEAQFKNHFRLNSFLIGSTTRDAVNKGIADYTPVFFSDLPNLIYRKMIPIDVALIQVSPPDNNGYVSLGISVDIVKAAVENASLVIAQVNSHMPRVHGDTYLHIDDIDYLIPYDESLLEYFPKVPGKIAQKIGKYVARIVEDGDTIQVGYGSLPNAILPHLDQKQHLGVHSELITDGIVNLMKKKVIDNSRKSINRGKTIAAFCLGTKEAYEYLHENPLVEFRTTSYTNDPMIIAKHTNMTAINSALRIDLTGQATSESLGKRFYSGIGGQADFMRGATFSKRGKTILVIESTARGGEISRIVPHLEEGSGISVTRGDVHYVVTEYGIAYLHGKSIRERAMDLIAIAHPKFRPWLIEKAKEHNLIYKDQAYVPGQKGDYAGSLRTYKTTKAGIDLSLRPAKISDEPLLKDFFYSLSDDTFYRRFVNANMEMPHERLQNFIAVNYSREMIILALEEFEQYEKIVGVGQYCIDDHDHTAEVALVVQDTRQRLGIGTEIMRYLTRLAIRQGLHGFTAEVLVGNNSMMRLFEKMGFDLAKRTDAGVYELKMGFNGYVYND